MPICTLFRIAQCWASISAKRWQAVGGGLVLKGRSPPGRGRRHKGPRPTVARRRRGPTTPKGGGEGTIQLWDPTTGSLHFAHGATLGPLVIPENKKSATTTNAHVRRASQASYTFDTLTFKNLREGLRISESLCEKRGL